MECEIVDAATLPDAHRERWTALVRSQPLLDGPAFRPQFVCSLAAYVPHCKVAIVRSGTEVVGYVSFVQAPGSAVAAPIPMCDYAPIVIAPGTKLDARALTRGLGLHSWKFENVVTDRLDTAAATRLSVASSPRAAIGGDYDAYLAELNAAGRSSRNIRTKLRLLERDHGRVGLVHDLTDERVLTALLQRKAMQYATGGEYPPFVEQALRHFLYTPPAGVTGKLSVLMAGERAVASLFSLKVERLLYYWFPTYGLDFQRYSPGLLLLWLLLKDLPALDCDTVDFGPGGEQYKEYFANAHRTVWSGEVHANAVAAALRRTTDRVNHRLRSSAIAVKVIRPIVRRIRKLRGID